MLVGHEPLLSAVYAYLLGSGSVQIDVKKGSLGRVDVDRFNGAPRGVLRWLIHPKLVGKPAAESYSYRSAIKGSTLAARRAGPYAASSAERSNTIVTAANVYGSAAETS